MASTYSALKIQLMATGENSGTWGSVTNVNLGTAIEEAIVGSDDVTFNNADVTLTLADTNATQTARNLRLNLTGTVTTTQSLIVPAIEKVYIINNGLSQTITVKNATGTGIAVPSGRTMYVYNNGSNVLDAITHLTSLTLETPLAVAQGGTGSNTATFSGANITSLNASNISSGTIANARTTATDVNGASTIVARDASGNFAGNTITGNSFSGSGASLTSLNASNISSGTLSNSRLGTVGVANGGTGTTTLTANNVILGNATSAVQFVAPGTSGNVLTSNGTTWTSVPGGAFAAGTVMLFAQTAAPTGWTKNTSTGDNSALRVVTGTASTGGSVAFTTAFASQTPTITISAITGSAGATTLTTPQIPSHLHFIGNNSTGSPPFGTSAGDSSIGGGAQVNTGATGGGGSHTHPFSFSSGTATSSAINLAVQYIDVIRATKD